MVVGRRIHPALLLAIAGGAQAQGTLWSLA